MIREKTDPCASVISVFFDKASRMASVLLCAICGRKQATRMAIQHPKDALPLIKSLAFLQKLTRPI